MITRRALLGGVVATAALGSLRPAASAQAGESVDLRNLAYTMPARTQGQGSSCVVWAASHGVAWMMARHHSWRHPLSIPVMDYFRRMEARPETSRTSRMMADTARLGYVFDQHPRTRCLPSWTVVAQQSSSKMPELLRQAIRPGHPVVVTLLAPDSRSRWTADTPGSYGHAVLALGFTPEGILFKNSWGAKWGPYGNGYGFMTDAFVREWVDGAYALTGIRTVAR